MAQLQPTHDGSSTLYSTNFDETYHSTHGARQEAEHVFIQEGLFQKKEAPTLRLCEYGFGSGFNALLTFIHSQHSAQSIWYTGIEAYPISHSTAALFKETLPSAEQPHYDTLIRCSWEKPHQLTPQFTLYKTQQLFQTHTPQHTIDLAYFDAFSPRKQPDCWSEAIFTTLYHKLHPTGFLVTYCAKGSIKRLLRAIGYHVCTLPGPPGKREMIRAYKEHP